MFLTISETGMYNVLRKSKLNHRIDRLFYTRDKSHNLILTERYIRKIAKIKPAHIKANYPSHLFCQDTFYVDTIKGLFKIYQQAGIYDYSNFGFTKEYLYKNAIIAKDFLNAKALQVYR